MAKDAKGHGSEARGEHTLDMVYSSKAGVGGLGKGMYARTASGAQYKLNPAATEGRIPHVGSDIDPSQHTAVADKAAATMLAGGHPKSGVVPVHSGASGYNRESVNQAIASSNRAGRRIGGKEASAIHRLLRGRH